mgnify:CR=1 FL=1
MSTLRSAVAMTSASLVILFLRVGTISVVARLLKPADFGLVAVALSLSMVIGIIAQLDIRDALIQRASISHAHLRLAWGLMIATGGCFAGGLAFAAPGLEKVFGLDGLSDVIPLMAVIIVFQALSVAPEAVLIRAGKVPVVARAQFFGFLIGFSPVAITAALAGWGVFSLVAAYIAQNSITFLALTGPHFAARERAVTHRRSVSTASGGEAAPNSVLRDLLRFSILGSSNRLLTKSGENIDNLVVGAILEASAVGIYSRAYNLAGTPVNTLIGMTIRTAVFPAYARLEQETEKLIGALRHSITAAMLILGPLAALLIISADEVVAVLLGSQWGAAVIPLQLLAPALALRSAPRLAAALGRAKARLGLIFLTNAGMTALLAGLTAAGGHLGGVNGAAGGAATALNLFWLASVHNCAQLSGASMMSLIGAYLRPLALTAIFSAGALAGTQAARMVDASALVTIAAGGALGAVVAGGALIWFPRLLLGAWASNVAAGALNKAPAPFPLSSRLKTRLVARLRTPPSDDLHTL